MVRLLPKLGYVIRRECSYDLTVDYLTAVRIRFHNVFWRRDVRIPYVHGDVAVARSLHCDIFEYRLVGTFDIVARFDDLYSARCYRGVVRGVVAGVEPTLTVFRVCLEIEIRHIFDGELLVLLAIDNRSVCLGDVDTLSPDNRVTIDVHLPVARETVFLSIEHRHDIDCNGIIISIIVGKSHSPRITRAFEIGYRVPSAVFGSTVGVYELECEILTFLGDLDGRGDGSEGGVDEGGGLSITFEDVIISRRRRLFED